MNCLVSRLNVDLRSVLLLAVVLVAPLPALAAEPVYTVTQGAQWKGVKIGGEAPRTLDNICKDTRCYRLKNRRPLPTRMMQKYALSDVRFESLSRVEGAVRQGNRLTLPADLGDALYMRAYWDNFRIQLDKDD